MIEVVFGYSEKGTFKVAKNYRNKDWMSTVSVSQSENIVRREEKEDKVQPIGGDSRDVICLGYGLDVGYIVGEVDGIERQKAFEEIHGIFNVDAIEHFQKSRKDTQRLLDAASKGIPIRIWKSNAPYSMCGFYYVCDLLRHIDCDLRVISLPEYRKRDDNAIVSYTGWGEVEAGELYTFLPLEVVVDPNIKRMNSNKWKSLLLENAPLRAIVNGQLISVPEDFYDHIIINNMPDGEFKMYELIGRAISKQLGINDSWYAFRIRKMIAENKLEIIKDDKSCPYRKVLKKMTV